MRSCRAACRSGSGGRQSCPSNAAGHTTSSVCAMSPIQRSTASVACWLSAPAGSCGSSHSYSSSLRAGSNRPNTGTDDRASTERAAGGGSAVDADTMLVVLRRDRPQRRLAGAARPVLWAAVGVLIGWIGRERRHGPAGRVAPLTCEAPVDRASPASDADAHGVGEAATGSSTPLERRVVVAQLAAFFGLAARHARAAPATANRWRSRSPTPKRSACPSRSSFPRSATRRTICATATSWTSQHACKWRSTRAPATSESPIVVTDEELDRIAAADRAPDARLVRRGSQREGRRARARRRDARRSRSGRMAPKGGRTRPGSTALVLRGRRLRSAPALKLRCLSHQ